MIHSLPLAARDPWIELAKPTGDELAQIRKCRRSQDGAGDYKARSRLGRDVDLSSQREHLSPIEWENRLLYGQHLIDRSLIRTA